MLTIQLIVIFLPLALLAAIALQRPPGLLMYLLSTLAMASGIAFAWMVMPWDVVTVYWRILVPFAVLAAAVHGYRRIGTAEKTMSGWAKGFNYAVNILTLLFLTA